MSFNGNGRMTGGTINNTSIGATTPSSATFTTLNANSSISVDTINEFTATAGVTIDGVLVKDSALDTSSAIALVLGSINATGITLTPQATASGGVLTDTIGEVTSDAGVTVDGVLLKDSGIDRSTSGILTLGATNATSITLSQDTTISGNLTVTGIRTSIDSATVLVSDPHLYLNKDYTTASAKTGGLVVNYLPTATTDTTTGAGVFVAGVDATSNPTVTTAGAATFAASDFIQINGAADAGNNGLFEVLSHSSNTLTIRGVGTTAVVEDFSQNQFTANAGDTGASITKVNVSIFRAGTDGVWETAAGSSTGLTFNDISSLTTPGATTDNGIVTWNGTDGTAVQDTAVTIDDDDNIVLADAGGNLILGVETLSRAGTGAFSSGPDASIACTYLVTTTGSAGNATATLADPTGTLDVNGTIKHLIAREIDGSVPAVITISSFQDAIGSAVASKTATFDTAGQSLMLIWNTDADGGAGAWFQATTGATIS